MQPYSENYNLSNKRWRAIRYDFDTLSQYSNTNGKLYCLSDFQASWLQSNVPYISWSTRWDNCPCTDDDLSQFAAELEFALMSCVDFQPYQLQYVYDQTTQEQLGVFNDDYTGTPSSVNSNSPDDFFSGDSSLDRVNALCSACKVYVYSYSANWQTKAQIALGIVGIFTALASISLIGGVIAGTILAGLSFITATALNAMQDETALDNVVCCMFNALNGTVINQANFETSLDACGFTVGSNEAIIRDIIASDLTQFLNYLSFINALGDQFVLSQNGIYDCPCETQWTHTFDFITDNTPQGWTPYAGRAVLNVDGWTQTPALPTNVQIQTTFPNTFITSIEMFNSGLASGACGTQRQFRAPDVFGGDYSNSTNDSIVSPNVFTTGIWLDLCTDDDTSIRIEQVIVKGTGVNPF